MKYSNMINPALLLDGEQIVIIRMAPDFPNYKTYSDIDLIGHDLAGFKSRVWAKYLNLYGPKGFHVTEQKTPFHCHLDFYPPGFKRLDLMFDLMPNFDCYHKSKVIPAFYDHVISRAQTIDKGGFKVRVPHQVDEIVLKYLEYKLHPNKKKHRDYVRQNKNQEFLDLLDKYTGISYDG